MADERARVRAPRRPSAAQPSVISYAIQVCVVSLVFWAATVALTIVLAMGLWATLRTWDHVGAWPGYDYVAPGVMAGATFALLILAGIQTIVAAPPAGCLSRPFQRLSSVVALWMWVAVFLGVLATAIAYVSATLYPA